MEYKPDMEAKKKISPTFRLTILTILVFVGVSVIGVGFLLVSDRVNRRLSDIENTLASLRRERNHIPNISDASSFQLSHRKKRSVSSNASPSQSDFEKRLQALEKRWEKYLIAIKTSFLSTDKNRVLCSFCLQALACRQKMERPGRWERSANYTPLSLPSQDNSHHYLATGTRGTNTPSN